MRSLIAIAALAVAAALELSFSRKVGVNTYNYGDPATGCMANEMNVSVTGLAGDFCSPQCDSSQNCPTNYPPKVTAQGECVLEVNGSQNPTYCALICDPNGANQCGAATCQPIQGTGVCTYSS